MSKDKIMIEVQAKPVTFQAVHVESLKGRVTDAKNRAHVGSAVSDALNAKLPVYIIVGELVENEPVTEIE